ncbi:MAG TPA: hypothetical protein VGA35_09720 [bacterium]
MSAAPAGARTARVPRTVYIEFEGHQVAVGSDTHEVLAGLESMYSAMIVPAAGRAVRTLVVSGNGGSYRITGDTAFQVADGSLSDVLRCLRFSVIQGLMQARPDLLWFHAGAAAADGRAILLLGPRGRGKSTLIVSLCARGWSYLSDDVVPLNPASSRAVPFPLTPARREFPGQEMPADWLRSPTKVDVPLPSRSLGRHPVPVGALVFPKYRIGAPARLSPCPPAEAAAELLQHCWNFAEHGKAALRRLCDLAARVPAYHLSFSNGDLATDLLALLRLREMPPAGAKRDSVGAR